MGKTIVIIAGPTASGKTKTSIEVAKKLNTEIVSADSMQIYKYMDIGTAKPKRSEMEGIPHHMIDVVYPDEDFSVAVYREMAGQCVDSIISKNKIPIVVGGTGLYINSFLYNMDFTETPEDTEYRNYLKNYAVIYGNEALHSLLKGVDKESYERLHANDTKRIIRALEVHKNTGKTITKYQAESQNQSSDYNCIYIGLNMDRKKLYGIINKRVDNMFNIGLIDEVKNLIQMGYNKNLKSMSAIGYKEIFDYLEGIYTLEEVKETIKRNTRRYAKRQITWFKHQGNIHWVNVDDFNSISEIAENILQYIEGSLGFL
jgi:tRNA dimethylallyltransferase